MKESNLNTYDDDTVKILAEENTIKILEDKKAKI